MQKVIILLLITSVNVSFPAFAPYVQPGEIRNAQANSGLSYRPESFLPYDLWLSKNQQMNLLYVPNKLLSIKNSVGCTLELCAYAATCPCCYRFSLIPTLCSINRGSGQRKRTVRLIVCASKSTFSKCTNALTWTWKNIKKIPLEDTKYWIHLSSYLLLHNKSSRLSGLKQYKYPPFCFLKVFFMTLHSCKRPILVPVFLNRNLKRIFNFTENAKRENSAWCLFCSELFRGRGTPNESGPTKLLPQELQSAYQHQAPELWTVWQHLCFNGIYFLQLLTRCVLRYQ